MDKRVPDRQASHADYQSVWASIINRGYTLDNGMKGETMPTEPTVYVIDDEPDICKVLSDILEAAHIKVKTYTSPRRIHADLQPGEPRVPAA